MTPPRLPICGAWCRHEKLHHPAAAPPPLPPLQQQLLQLQHVHCVVWSLHLLLLAVAALLLLLLSLGQTLKHPLLLLALQGLRGLCRTRSRC